MTTLYCGATIDFKGQFYSMRNAELRPRGPRAHGPPIMVGAIATGPRMLRLAAQYADLWMGILPHPFGENAPEQVPTLRDALDAACRKVQRDPATLLRTVTVDVDLSKKPPPIEEKLTVGSSEEIAETLRAFGREGISPIQVGLTPTTLDGLEAFAPVLDAFDRG